MGQKTGEAFNTEPVLDRCSSTANATVPFSNKGTYQKANRQDSNNISYRQITAFQDKLQEIFKKWMEKILKAFLGCKKIITEVLFFTH